MKKDIHPKYQTVLFIDSATGRKWLCGSTVHPEERGEFEGKTYPAVYLPTSSASHPYFTGSSSLADTEGRIQKFKNRYASVEKKRQEVKEANEVKKPEAAAKKGKKA